MISLLCPLMDCESQLHLVRSSTRPLYWEDLDDVPEFEDYYTVTWQVECEEGHVVLLPEHPDDVEYFEDADAKRLSELCLSRHLFSTGD